MKKHVGIISAIATLILFGAVFVANAQSNPFAIEFPVAELGNCGSIQECKVFCDEPANGEACFAFAQSHGLVKEKDVQKHEEKKKFNEQRREAIEQESGPGGCTSEKSCREFCSDPKNGDECLAFARKHKILSEEELDRIEGDIEDARRGQETIQTQGGPGGCTSPEACNAFCRKPANRKICFEFAKEHNLIPPEELARIEEQGGAEGQTGPGGCDSREACDAFCRTPANMTTCLDFAIERGEITREEASQFLTNKAADNIRPRVRGPQIRGPEPKINEEKARQLLETTGGPGGCASFEECDAFCNTPENEETCFAFAKEQGLMDAADVEKIDKLRNAQGPGGCRGRQCEQYCSQDGHEEECLNFAIDQGLIPPEEIEHAKKFIDIAKKGGPGGCKGRQCEDFCNRPENQEQCFAFAKENNLIPQEEIQKMERLQNTMKSGGGPGGCTSEQTCRSYCQDATHFEECAAFAVGAGLMKPEEAMMHLEEFVGAGQGGPQGFGSGGGQQGFGQGQGRGFGPPGGSQGFGQGQQQGFGRPGKQGFGGPQGMPPGMEGEFQKQYEERFKQFEQFRSQFEDGGQGGPGFPPGPGGFGGEGDHEGFPGQGEGTSGEFPGGGATQGNFPPGQGVPPGGAGAGTQGRGPMRTPRMPQSGQGTGEGQQGFQQQFEGELNKQFDQQYNKQFEEEVNRQTQQQGGQQPGMGGFPPPGGTGSFGQPGTGGFPPPGGSTGSFDHSGTGSFVPQTGGTMPQPTGTYPPPTGSFGTFQQPPTGSFPPPTGDYHPPTGTYPPPTGTYPPPPTGSFTPPPPTGDSGGMMPPPTGSFTPPPPPAFTSPPPTTMPPPTMMPPPSGDGGMMMPPPGAFGNITHMIATVLGAFLQIFH